MSKLQRFRGFVNERLAAAALEIFEQFEKSFAECQEEICFYKEKCARLQHVLDFQPEIQLHRTGAHRLSLPEPQIKEEEELWRGQGRQQLPGQQFPGLQSCAADLPSVETHSDPEDSSPLTPLNQMPTVENKGTGCSSIKVIEVQIKSESDEEDQEAPIPYPCEQCDRVFSTKGGLVTHSRIHAGETSYQCDGTFSQTDLLITHGRRINTGKKPYQCQKCDKAFIYKKNLLRHEVIHTCEQPYQCEKCDRSFIRKRDLVNHGVTHAEKPYQCEQCDSVFSVKSSLVTHRRIHTGDKPYQCEECDEAFVYTRDLVKHRRTHAGETPYQCELCDSVFSVKSSLVTHRRIHTGEKPYQCKVCDKAFAYSRDLVKHKRTHTGS